MIMRIPAERPARCGDTPRGGRVSYRTDVGRTVRTARQQAVMSSRCQVCGAPRDFWCVDAAGALAPGLHPEREGVMPPPTP